jgi:hypothetical protein
MGLVSSSQQYGIWDPRVGKLTSSSPQSPPISLALCRAVIRAELVPPVPPVTEDPDAENCESDSSDPTSDTDPSEGSSSPEPAESNESSAPWVSS